MLRFPGLLARSPILRLWHHSCFVDAASTTHPSTYRAFHGTKRLPFDVQDHTRDSRIVKRLREKAAVRTQHYISATHVRNRRHVGMALLGNGRQRSPSYSPDHLVEARTLSSSVQTWIESVSSVTGAEVNSALTFTPLERGILLHLLQAAKHLCSVQIRCCCAYRMGGRRGFNAWLRVESLIIRVRWVFGRPR